MRVLVTMRTCMRQRQFRNGGGPRRLYGAQQAAALAPHQPCAECRDQAVTCDFDDALDAAHGLGGDVEQPRADADDQHRDQRLRQRGDERQHDAAPRGLLIGDEIGGDHRLAVTGTRGVEDAVSERNAEQRPHGAAIVLRRADRRRHGPVEFGLLREQPADDAADLLVRHRTRTAERVLRQRRVP